MTDVPSELIGEIIERLRQSNAKAAAGRPLDGDTVPVDPAEEAELIVSDVLARGSKDPRAAAFEVLARRESGELLGHILGRVKFLGCEMLTSPDCVVPRKETELLGRTAIAALAGAGERSSPSTDALLVIDMCCGAGNLACAIANQLQNVRVWAADLTDGCCELARRNVSHLGLTERVKVMQGDLFAGLVDQGLEARVELVCCNPPYISTTRLETDRSDLLSREPREAFDGGPYGLSIHQRVLRDATAFLKPKGWLMFEIGVGQERQFESLVRRTRGLYGEVRWEKDNHGRPRVAVVQRTEQGS